VFDLIAQPAQQCCRLDVAYRKTVTEPDNRFPATGFQGYFIHYTFISPGKGNKTNRERKTYLIREFTKRA
jgi:hypothetical protein